MIDLERVNAAMIRAGVSGDSRPYKGARAAALSVIEQLLEANENTDDYRDFVGIARHLRAAKSSLESQP